MRNLKMALVATVLAGATVFTWAAPAQAAPILRGVYYENSECHRVGNYGIQNGYWSGPYQCVWYPVTGNYPPGYWFLYA